MPFTFVNNADIDRPTRRLIRSHVMKGKNAGRTLKRKSQSRVQSQSQHKAIAQVPETADTSYSVVTYRDAPASIQRLVGHQYSSYIFPLDLNHEEREITHTFFTVIAEAIYPCEFCGPIEVKKEIWAKSMTWDIASSNDAFRGRTQSSPAVLNHFIRAIKLINEKLTGEEALTDTTLYVVLGFVLYEQLRHNPKEWRIHLEGLRRIIELRGGLATFEDQPYIVRKICRADIDFALSEGCPTQFTLDDIPSSVLCCDVDTDFRDLPTSTLPFDFSDVAPALCEVAEGVLSLAGFLNHAKRTDGHLDVFQPCLISLSYQLIRLCPLGTCCFDNEKEEGLHLGLVAFMSTLVSQFGRHPLLRRTILSTRLMFFLNKDGCSLVGGEFLLWLLFMGRISVFTEDDLAWLVPKARALVKDMDISGWPSQVESLGRFPWVNYVHDEPGWNFWKSIEYRDSFDIL